jgi:prepilin-type N-terminal cleavage/methylation domain-containing protein
LRDVPRAAVASPAGFTLVEVVLSMLIVGLVIVAAIETVGAAIRTQTITHDRARAMLLAQDLMNEILQQAYQEPIETPIVFGREASEPVGPAVPRTAFDDVDDYHNWNTTNTRFPPQARDGTPLEGFEGWSRSVVVDYVGANNLGVVTPTPSGIKRITIRVRKGEAILAALRMIVTESWQAPPYD